MQRTAAEAARFAVLRYSAGCGPGSLRQCAQDANMSEYEFLRHLTGVVGRGPFWPPSGLLRFAGARPPPGAPPRAATPPPRHY
eukprot:4499800-Pyramimonas_sp.AAC.1